MKNIFFLICLFLAIYAKSSNTPKDTIIFSLPKDGTGKINVQVSFIASDDIYSLDFSMKFNLKKIQYDTLLKQAYYLDDAVGYYNPTDSTLRVTSYSSTNKYVANESIMLLVFNINSTVDTTDFYSLNGYLNGNQAVVIFKKSLSGVKEIRNDNIFKVFPIPSTDKVNIEISGLTSYSYNIEITDITGKQILALSHKYPDSKEEINIHNFPQGEYLIKVYNDKTYGIQKLIIGK